MQERRYVAVVARVTLVAVVAFGAGCRVRVPGAARAGAAVAVQGNVRVDVQARAQAQVVPPAPAVALQGAPVVEFFGIPLEGAQDVVFVLDCSGSMEEPAQGAIAQIAAPANPAPAPAPPGAAPPPPPPVLTKLAVARGELIDALQRLPEGTRLNVIFFNRDLDAVAPGLVPLEQIGRDGLIGFVSDTVATGGTALAPAMRTAFLMNARRVVLLSDGLGNIGGDSWDVLRDAREAMHGGVRIDTVGIGSGQDSSLLGSLAGESGGLYQAL
jgi:hypothetical protein